MYGEQTKIIQQGQETASATVNFKRLFHIRRKKYDNIFIILFVSEHLQHFTMIFIDIHSSKHFANMSKHSFLCLHVAHRLVVQQ